MAKAKVTKYRFRTKFYRYNGIPYNQVKGVKWHYQGQLCPGRHLWPQEIAAFYRNLGSMEV